jgi:hypothetical protein
MSDTKTIIDPVEALKRDRRNLHRSRVSTFELLTKLKTDLDGYRATAAAYKEKASMNVMRDASLIAIGAETIADALEQAIEVVECVQLDTVTDKWR